MKFTYDAYREMLRSLKKHEYKFCKYDSCDFEGKKVILRHDIDMSIEKAVEMAKIEKEEGAIGNYFVIISSDLYNFNSRENQRKIKEIVELGGVIGLHFDEVRYDDVTPESILKYIELERTMLESVTGGAVNVVSMHRPSKWVLEENIEIPKMINAYSKKFLKEFKYVSDSRMNWRDDVMSIIDLDEYEKLCILTHAFWYGNEEKTTKEILLQFIESAKKERFNILKDNVRDIYEFISESDIEG